MALIQTCQIQAIMTVPERLSFPAQLSNCNLATCWHIELSILGLLHLSISIHLALVVLWNSFFGWPWANLALLAQRQKNTGVQCPVSTFSYFHGKAFPGKPATITFGKNKVVNSWIKFRLLYDKSFAPALGGACAMGTNTMALIQMCQIQAIMTVPERLSFPAQLSNWQSCHMLAHWTQHTGSSPPFNQHSFSFNCSMKFFLRLALGESCAACTTTEKHWCPVSTFSYFHGKAFLGKPATITFGENKDVNSWIKFILLHNNSLASALGGACARGTNTMALIQTCQIQAIMTVPRRLSFPAQLLNCNLATCWHIASAYWAFSYNIHSSIGFSCSIKFFRLKRTLGLALGESWLLLAQPQKNTDVHKGLLPVGRLSYANLQQSPSAKTRM